MSDTLNPEAAAPLLHCTPETVEEELRKGNLPGVKIGRTWVLVRADLLAYLSERGRREAEERRLASHARAATPPPASALVKPRRQTPPPLPQPATAAMQDLQRESSRTAAP